DSTPSTPRRPDRGTGRPSGGGRTSRARSRRESRPPRRAARPPARRARPPPPGGRRSGGRRCAPTRGYGSRVTAIQDAIARLVDGHDLSRADARTVMGEIMAGEATPGQIGGFLAALRAKGETVDEIAGCAEAMREHAIPVRPERTDLVDTAGTGGDGAATLNISTAAAIVAAAAGAGVAKQGSGGAGWGRGVAGVPG